jgi:hypothetical protein
LGRGADLRCIVRPATQENWCFAELVDIASTRMRVRMIEYCQTLDRNRVWRHTGEHLAIIGLLEKGSIDEAAQPLDMHIGGALNEKARPELFKRF